MNKDVKEMLEYINEEYFKPDNPDEFDDVNNALEYAIKSISVLDKIEEILEPLRNYNTNNKYLEELKIITR